MTRGNFFLYRRQLSNSRPSSVFELFGGKTEPKQTGALGWLLSVFPKLALRLLRLPQVRERIGAERLRKLRRGGTRVTLETDAELPSLDGTLRRDITMIFRLDGVPDLSVVIEAKSFGIEAEGNAVAAQLRTYLSRVQFPVDVRARKVGILLTKNNLILGPEGRRFATVTWDEILGIVRAEARAVSKGGNGAEFLLTDFVSFIQNSNGFMHYYEAEVVSFNATKSYHLVKQSSVFGCPLRKIAKPLFVTFRRAGGHMDILHKVIDVIELPSGNIAALKNRPNLPNRARALQYLRGHQRLFKKIEPTRLYVLSDAPGDQILLHHQPRCRRGANVKDVLHYSLAEMLSGATEV